MTTAPHPRADAPVAVPSFDVDPSPPPPPEGSQVPYGATVSVGIPNPIDGSVPQTKIVDVSRWIFARMTIRQRVTQFGGGWGSVVAGPTGEWLPGFNNETCVLAARMYSIEPNGRIGAELNPGTCPDDNSGQPDVIDGYYRFPVSTIYGNRKGGANNPHPLSCEGGCYTYGGSTKYIFTPTSDRVVVTPSPSSVIKGSEVTFTASRADGVALGSVAGWVWTPSDTSAPVQTIACATTNTTCTTQVFEDGWMFAQVMVGTDLHTAYAAVTVTLATVVLTASTTTPTYGDSVTYSAATQPANAPGFAIMKWEFEPDDPTQPPTSVPCTDNPCTDPARLPGDMWVHFTLAGQTDSTSVHISVNDPQLTVNCFATVVRGSSVDCRIWVSRPVAYTLVARQSRGEFGAILSEPNSSHAAGDTARWSGPGVADTRVTVQVRLAYGKVITGSGSFTVTPRAWDAWRLIQAPITANAIFGSMPPHIAGDSATIAGFYLNDIDTLSINVLRVPAGPDSGLAYIGSLPALPRSSIYYHPDLQPGTDWYKDQNGKNGTCKAPGAINTLMAEVRRHEGETMSDTSHFGVANAAFIELQPHLQIEKLVSIYSDDIVLKTDVQFAFATWRDGPHHARQQEFDKADYPKIWNKLGCSLDLNPLNP